MVAAAKLATTASTTTTAHAIVDAIVARHSKDACCTVKTNVYHIHAVDDDAVDGVSNDNAR